MDDTEPYYYYSSDGSYYDYYSEETPTTTTRRSRKDPSQFTPIEQKLYLLYIQFLHKKNLKKIK